MDAIQCIDAVRISDRLFIESLIVGRISEATHFLERLKSSAMWKHVSKEDYLKAIEFEQLKLENLHGLLDRFRNPPF